MIKKAEEMKKIQELCPCDGAGRLQLTKMSDYMIGKPEKLKTYAYAELDPGSEVGFHLHRGESETYYILSGEGEYNDNGLTMPVGPGDVTFTPSGSGHGIRNVGKDKLCFMALIIFD